MRRCQKIGAEQVVLKLRQIEVQTAQNKSLALACKKAEISAQSYDRWRKETLVTSPRRRARSKPRFHLPAHLAYALCSAT